MKKIAVLLFALLNSFLLLAQEEQAPEKDTLWSDEVKIYWLIGMSIMALFFVIRTFRNKPEA